METSIKEILIGVLFYTFIWVILFSISRYNEDAFDIIIDLLAIILTFIMAKKISKWLLKNNE